jgi:hypothetical protein
MDRTYRTTGALAPAILLLSIFSAGSVAAGGLDFQGSLGAAGGHTRYVPPVTNPLFNETPYITTELRPLFLHNEIPSDFLTGGGSIDVVAAEIRVALTDRLGIIASKDGFANIDFKRVLPDDSGLANVSLGLKYAVLSDPATNTILSLGAEYEAPSGDLKAGPIRAQGAGSGFVDFFLTGAKAFGRFGLQANAGVNLALDQSHDSSMVHYSLHADYEVLAGLFPLIEFNGFSIIDHGKRTPLGFEGVDLVNFGSTGGGTVVTAAAGARYRFNQNLQLGVAYERAITNREDILDWRVYFDLVISY